jgi:hypothetical protein
VRSGMDATEGKRKVILLVVIAVIAVLVGLLEDMIERRKKGEPF